MTSGSSASENPTLARAVKCLSPKYTASAPASIAARSWGQYPAGLMTSGLRRGDIRTTSSVTSGREYDMAGTINLYQAVGGAEGCHRLSTAFYARVAHDPVLRPFFPGKSFRCAIEALSAFLVPFLGGL